MSNYRHSKHGVFKPLNGKKAGAAQGQPKPPMPEIFKLTWPDESSNEEPKILVTNEDGSKKAEIPLSSQMLALFDGRKKIYVIGTADPVGGLQATSVIIGPTW